MSDDSIEVKLGATDEGLQAGLEGAAAQTQESTNAMAEAFVALREKVAAAMAGVGTAVAEGLKETKEQVAETRETLEGFATGIGNVQKMLGLIGEVAAFGFIGEQVTELARQFAEWGDQMERTQAQTGLTAQTIQELQFAGKTAGLSAQDMSVAMEHLSRSMAQAQEGNKQAENAYKSLGISMDEIKGKSLDTVLEKVAQSFSDHADGANKAALAMQLFGRSGDDMIAFLDKGKAGIDDLRGRAEALGVVLGQDTTEQAASLNEAFVEMDAQMDAAKKRAGEELAPSFLQISNAMSKVTGEGGLLNEFFEALATALKAVISVGISFVGVFEEIAQVVATAARAVYAAAHGDFKAATDEINYGLYAVERRAIETDAALKKLWGNAKLPEAPKESEGGGTRHPDFHLYQTGGGHKGNNGASADRALQEAENAASLALTKEKLSEEKSLYADQYANGLLTAQQYYAKLLEIQKAELEAERKNKEDDLKAAQKATATDRKGSDKSKVTEDLAKEVALKGEIAVLDQKLANAGPENARQEADAVRKLNEQLALTDISKTQNVGKSMAEGAKAQAEMLYATGQISKQQLTALEEQLQNDLYQIDMAALQQKLALYNQDTSHNPQKIAEVNAQIEQLEAQHQAQMTRLAAQATEEQMANSKQATDDLEQGFEKAFSSFASGTETARKAFSKFLTSIQQELTQLVSKDLLGKVFNMDTGGGSINSMLQQAFGKLFGGGAGGALGQAGQDAALTANTTGLTTLTAAITELIASMQAQSAGGLNSLLNSVTGGGGQFAGDFGFTSAFSGSADAVAGGAMADSGGGMSALMGLASFDVGSNYIPTDMVAQIHKGEAIVPAHLNSPYSNPNNVAVTQNFNVPGGADLRTQQQIFAMAGMGIQNALRRNG